MTDRVKKSAGRTFKTSWFNKTARKAHITDEELCSAIQQVMMGQADDLGGGVFKKRLKKNQHRAILLAKIGRYGSMSICSPNRIAQTLTTMNWADFRKLAKAYGNLTRQQINQLLQNNDWMEICNGNKA